MWVVYGYGTSLRVFSNIVCELSVQNVTFSCNTNVLLARTIDDLHVEFFKRTFTRSKYSASAVPIKAASSTVVDLIPDRMNSAEQLPVLFSVPPPQTYFVMAQTDRPYSVVDDIAAALNIPKDALNQRKMQSKQRRETIRGMLVGRQLRTNHMQPRYDAYGRMLDRNFIVTFHHLTRKHSVEQHACGGYLDINVRQYFYVRHSRTLDYPFLPCVATCTSNGQFNYFPLECLTLVYPASAPTYKTL